MNQVTLSRILGLTLATLVAGVPEARALMLLQDATVNDATAPQFDTGLAGTGGGAGSGSRPSSPVDSRCQSSTLCVFAGMPLYYQQDSSLEQYVRSRAGVYNPGLCVPTSTAMFLGGILSESTGTRSPWLTKFESQWDYRQRIFETGVASHTDFAKGGTYLGDTQSLVSSLSATSSGTSKDSVVADGIGPLDNTHPGTSDFIARIRADKVGYVVSMDAHSRKRNFWGTSWKYKSGHGLAINGYDRDALKIYDPWAEIYYVRLHTEHLKVNGVGFGKDRSVVEMAADAGANDWGFVSQSQSEGLKIILSEYLGWKFD